MNGDRKALFWLAALAIVSLAGIAFGGINGRIPSDSQTLLGVIASGLLLFAREIVSTIRAAWTDERTGALTDHLAAAAPLGDAATGKPDDPVHTVEEPK